MNIFALDTDPWKAARFHNDQHCVKMILEYCQMMAMAHMMLDGSGAWHPDVTVRKLGQARTYRNHPCALWTRACDANYRWLHFCVSELATEFKDRYGHVHLYAVKGRAIDRLEKLPANIRISNNRRTPFALCMPEEYKQPDEVLAYRAYYNACKAHNWRAPAVTPYWIGVDTCLTTA